MRTGLEASTVTPGSTAPDASFTVPASVTCAQVTLGNTSTHTAIDNAFAINRMSASEPPVRIGNVSTLNLQLPHARTNSRGHGLRELARGEADWKFDGYQLNSALRRYTRGFMYCVVPGHEPDGAAPGAVATNVWLNASVTLLLSRLYMSMPTDTRWLPKWKNFFAERST